MITGKSHSPRERRLCFAEDLEERMIELQRTPAVGWFNSSGNKHIAVI
jgi:hypothetical protein